MTDSHGTATYDWDRLHRLTQVTEPDHKTISYEYDWNNNRTKMTDHIEATSKDTVYEYNTRGLLWKLTDRNGGTPTEYIYNDDGSLHTMTYPNGVVATYTYDPYRGWLTSLNHMSGSILIAGFTYEYNPTYWGKNGTRTAMVEDILLPNGTDRIQARVDYEYDELYRLTSEYRDGDYGYDKSYSYDGNGNRTRMIDDSGTTYYHYDYASKLGDYGTVDTPDSPSNTRLTYDGAGNTETITPPTGPVTTYAWDWNNKLTSVKEGEDTIAQFAYGGDGIRISETFDSGTTQFVHEGLLAELDGQGNFRAFYCSAPDGMISRLPTAGAMYYHGDGLWSVGAVTTGTPVSVSNAYSFDAWGNPLADSGGAWQPYQYVGQMSYYTHDQESGIRVLQLGARYYDPTIGRFVSRDPIGHQGGMNLYAYVAGRPTTFVDPLGLYGGGNATIGPAPSPWPSIGRPSPQPPPPDVDFPGCMMACIPVMLGPFLAPCLTCALLPPPANAFCAAACAGAMTGLAIVACDRACSCPFEPIPDPNYMPPRTPRPLPGFGGRPLPPVVGPPPVTNRPPWY